MKWKHFPRDWPFVWGIHRSPVNSPHKGQWRRALMFSLICVWINGWVNNRDSGDLRRHRAHYDVIVMYRIMITSRILFGSYPFVLYGEIALKPKVIISPEVEEFVLGDDSPTKIALLTIPFNSCLMVHRGVITHLCPYINDGLTKMKSGVKWATASPVSLRCIYLS